MQQNAFKSRNDFKRELHFYRVKYHTSIIKRLNTECEIIEYFTWHFTRFLCSYVKSLVKSFDLEKLQTQTKSHEIVMFSAIVISSILPRNVLEEMISAYLVCHMLERSIINVAMKEPIVSLT